MNHFLVHHGRDSVGVAVVNINPGEVARGATLDGKTKLEVTALDSIPLGHKIALKDLKVGDTVLKYGEDIGKVVSQIKQGAHVHVHNLKTKRW